MVIQNTRTPSSIELCDSGVFSRNAKGQRSQVSAPIRVTAIGHGIYTDKLYSVLRFVDRDGRLIKNKTVPTERLHRLADIVEFLTNAGYILPELPIHQRRLIQCLAASNPPKRITVAVVPGWHEKDFVLPDETFSPDSEKCQFVHGDGILLGDFASQGSLETWYKTIGQSAEYSSRIRLSIGAALAAPLVRLMKMDTFGFYIVGESSKGKTTCGIAGASVSLNTERGVTSWDSTQAGLEQLALGHRDCVLVLDDTSAIASNNADRKNFVSLAAFRLSKSRRKVRASEYDRATGKPDGDMKNVILASGETSLLSAGDRLRGSDVRMISVPVACSDLSDIFDSPRASRLVGDTPEKRARYVIGLKQSATENSGHLIRAFLSRLVNDGNAVDTIRGYMSIFEHGLDVGTTGGSRIARSFALTYGALCLAIDYNLLAYEKTRCLEDIKKCMFDALDLLSNNTADEPTTDKALLQGFCNWLVNAKVVVISEPKNVTHKDVRSADAFVILNLKKGKFRLKSKALRSWLPSQLDRNRLINLLRERKAFTAVTQNDVATTLTTIPHVTHRKRYYGIRIQSLGLEPSHFKQVRQR